MNLLFKSPLTTQGIAVVLSTYSGESAINLSLAINSIIDQTFQPVDFVIVGDGWLPEDQLRVIHEAKKRAQFPVRYMQLSENVGRGRARNFGIENTSAEFIAIMDSDDICLPSRLAAQFSFLLSNPHIDVLSTLTEEFDEDNIFAVSRIIKNCPAKHEDICNSLRLSNCVANPTLVMRRSCLERVGGFPDFRDINEDYLFYFRLISSGAKFACLRSIEVKVRLSDSQRRRRKGFNVIKSDIKFRLLAYRERHIGFIWAFLPLFLIIIRRLLPFYIDSVAQRCWRRLSNLTNC